MDELLSGEVVFTNGVIAVPAVSREQATFPEYMEQFFDSVEDSVEAVPVPVVRHVDQPFTASQLSSVATGGQPEAGAADTASATYVVSLLRSKLTKSSKSKRIKFKPNKSRGKIPSKSH